MSEQINRVLADRPQTFSNVEQKQARDNIGAAAMTDLSNYATIAQLEQETGNRYSGDTALQSAINLKLDASASSQFYLTSNPSAFISGVYHDSNLSGNGRTTPLGLNTSVVIDKYGDSANLTYESFSLVGNGGTPVLSATRGDIYMSGHAGNASSPYTANYGLQGMHVYGTDTYNHITATATLRYSGATFVEGSDSANIKATGMTLHTNDDGDQLVDASSVVRWNSYSSLSGFTGCSAGNCISGDGTSGSPLGISATAQWTAGGNWYPMTEISAGYLKISSRAFAGAQVYQDESSLCNWSPTGVTVRHSASSIGGGYIDNVYGEGLKLSYNAGEYYLRHISSDVSGLRAQQNGNPDNESIFGFGSAAFSDDNGATWEVVDPSSIRKWNNYSAGNWEESGNSLSTGFGGNQVTAASQYNDGAGNWSCRKVRMSGLPDQNLYGFQSKPQGTGTAYMVNPAGAFIQYQPTYFCKLYHKTGAVCEDLGTSIYPTGLTADARLDFVNLCSAASANIMTDTFHGNTAIFNPGQSATMWYIASADVWTDGGNDVPV